MKLHALTRLMNDRGTNPRVKIYKCTDMGAMLIYEGHPDAVDDEVKQLKVNSFTVLGKGLLEIHCSQREDIRHDKQRSDNKDPRGKI